MCALVTLLVPARAFAVDRRHRRLQAGAARRHRDDHRRAALRRPDAARTAHPARYTRPIPGPTTIEDSGWGEWINRLNAALRWGRWTAGLRLDSALYWRRPADNATYATRLSVSTSSSPRAGQRVALSATRSTPRSSGSPTRRPASRSPPATRTCSSGAGSRSRCARSTSSGSTPPCAAPRCRSRRDPFAVTAGRRVRQPVARRRGDRARALRDEQPRLAATLRQPVFGSDRLVGVDLQAGRGLPVTLSTHVVRFTRCAPYHYDGDGTSTPTSASDPATVTFGTCNATDTDTWLGVAQRHAARPARHTTSRWPGSRSRCRASGATASSTSRPPSSSARATSPGRRRTWTATPSTRRSSFDVGHHEHDARGEEQPQLLHRGRVGRAAGAGVRHRRVLVLAAGRVVQHARRRGDGRLQRVRRGRAPSRGRERHEGPPRSTGRASSRTRRPSSRAARATSSAARSPRRLIAAQPVQDVVYDGVGGFEYYFDDKLSHVFGSAGARDDTREDGVLPVPRAAPRVLDREVPRGPVVARDAGPAPAPQGAGLQPSTATHVRAHWWYEGENYVALRMAPKWVFTQGFEYTTLVGQPRLYFNGAVALQVHEQLERPRLRRRAARRLPLRERHLPLLPRVRGREGRADAAVLSSTRPPPPGTAPRPPGSGNTRPHSSA